jgi:hypothetical protein
MRRIAVVAGLLVLASAPAAFAAAWTVQPTPNPSRVASSALAGVSCGSNSSCIAVGSSTSHAGQQRALAERWDGTTWMIQSLPGVPGWTQSYLVGVSCVSATRCTAVGGGVDAAGKELTLAERWSGAHWTIQPTPNPSPAVPTHHLNGVACSSADACVAVGEFGRERFDPFYRATFHGLIERWNGRHWTVQYVIHASSGATNSLAAVSCSSRSACLAVGDSSSPDPGSPLAWRWDGRHWGNLHPPNHGEFAGLLGVSCSSASSCMAVGHFFVSRDQNAIAERWNGHHWTVRTPSRPAFAGGAELTGVACLSASHCTAVGAAGAADPTGGLAEIWTGMHWAIQSTPGGDGWPLQQVSCRPAYCAAVGFHDGFTLSERYS